MSAPDTAEVELTQTDPLWVQIVSVSLLEIV